MRSYCNHYRQRLSAWGVGLIFPLLVTFAPHPAMAQDFPSKPIHFISPVATGTVDLASRVIAGKLRERFGWTTIVETKAGGNFVPGGAYVATSAPDGYTLFVAPASFTLLPTSMKSLPFNVIDDFVPITQILYLPIVLLVNPSLPVNTLKDLIAYGKANPGKLSYSTTGAGSHNHLAGEYLKQATGLDMLNIPYKVNAAIPLMAGEVQVAIDSLPSSLALIKAGKVRPIVALSKERSKVLPDLRTAAEEMGIPGYEADSWVAFLAPKGTPSAIINKLSDAIISVVKLPEVQEQFLNLGAPLVIRSPEEFRKFYVSEVAKWARIVQSAGIKFE